jgi:hypothetical protein
MEPNGSPLENKEIKIKNPSQYDYWEGFYNDPIHLQMEFLLFL